ncbi:MAG: endonuclease/Exonuclease/phosphatase family protein [Acidimicrobiaceae bacterium]|nr:endonuclease/Exonuclease/phosphatase family protein [Acidimicrobiaceae bacterium]
MRSLDSDVVFLAEAFFPEEGDSLAEIAKAAGYEVVADAQLAKARILEPPPLSRAESHRWGPGGDRSPGVQILGHRRRRRIRRGRTRQPEAARGGIGVALLSRVPVRSAEVLPITRLKRDWMDRVALRAEVRVGDSSVIVVGTHFPHLSQGSPLRIAELRRLLAESSTPGVLMGDMNCFGPPLVLALPGWRRAVRGRTWPAWRPICQPDHVLVNRAVRDAEGEVLAPAGADHRPVRARISW